MILNSLFPVFALIGLGVGLKRWGITRDDFLKRSDRLVYFIFFPTMLFWKIGGTPLDGAVQWRFYLTVIGAVFCMFLVSIAGIRWWRVPPFQAGTFSQSCYRFNTYIGMAIILNALGEKGAALFGVLIGFVIPFINVMAVSILIWYSDKGFSAGERLRLTLKALISNPLIVACAAGIVYGRFFTGFPVFLDNTFRLVSFVALPMALLSIGGALTFATLRGHLRRALQAALVKIVLFPLIGYALLVGAGIPGTAFQVGMLFFTLPTSPAIYVLSSQLHSDTELASASIVLSTILSFASLSVALALFF